MISDHLPRTLQLKDGAHATLRNITVDDAAALVEFISSADGESDFLNRFPGEFDVTVEQEQAFLANLRDSPTDLMVTAEIDGHIAANGHWRGHALKRLAHHAELAVAVRQAHWGQGLGKVLMSFLIEDCRQRGLRKVWLQVMDHNERAIALYEALGFEHEGRCRGEILRADGSYGDMLRMGLPLVRS